MIIGLFIGFISGIVATLLSLNFLHIIRISIVRQNKNTVRRNTPKSPYSDINLMDTKYKYRDVS